VAGQRNYRHAEDFDWQAIRWQSFTVVSPRSEVNPEDQPDHHRRNAREDQVLQQDSLQPLAFERKLPSENPGNQHGHGGYRCPGQIAVRGRGEHASLCPARKNIEQNADEEKRDGKVNQNYVLRVFRKQNRLNVERVQVFLAHCTTTLPVIFG
jgi:hypothetical protein